MPLRRSFRKCGILNNETWKFKLINLRVIKRQLLFFRRSSEHEIRINFPLSTLNSQLLAQSLFYWTWVMNTYQINNYFFAHGGVTKDLYNNVNTVLKYMDFKTFNDKIHFLFEIKQILLFIAVTFIFILLLFFFYAFFCGCKYSLIFLL